MTSITTGSLQTFGRTFCKSPAFASAASRADGVRCHPSPPSPDWNHEAYYNYNLRQWKTFFCRGFSEGQWKTMETRMVSCKDMIHKWSSYCSIMLLNGIVFAIWLVLRNYTMSSPRLHWWPCTLPVLFPCCRSYTKPRHHFISSSCASHWNANEPQSHMHPKFYLY